MLVGVLIAAAVMPVVYVIATRVGIGDVGVYGRRATASYLVVMLEGNSEAIRLTNVDDPLLLACARNRQAVAAAPTMAMSEF